jgi:hypothetical protein
MLRSILGFIEYGRTLNTTHHRPVLNTIYWTFLVSSRSRVHLNLMRASTVARASAVAMAAFAVTMFLVVKMMFCKLVWCGGLNGLNNGDVGLNDGNVWLNDRDVWLNDGNVGLNDAGVMIPLRPKKTGPGGNVVLRVVMVVGTTGICWTTGPGVGASLNIFIFLELLKDAAPGVGASLNIFIFLELLKDIFLELLKDAAAAKIGDIPAIVATAKGERTA